MPHNVPRTEQASSGDASFENGAVDAKELIKIYAEDYGVSESSLLDTLKCESNLHHEDTYGDSGLAYGIAQFHEETFDYFKEKAEMPELDYKSEEDQIRLMAWAFANNKSNHWSCWKKVKANGGHIAVR